MSVTYTELGSGQTGLGDLLRKVRPPDKNRLREEPPGTETIPTTWRDEALLPMKCGVDETARVGCKGEMPA